VTVLTWLGRNGGKGDQLRLPSLLAPLVAEWGNEPANELKPQNADLVREFTILAKTKSKSKNKGKIWEEKKKGTGIIHGKARGL
jgi:hypothetical protein